MCVVYEWRCVYLCMYVCMYAWWFTSSLTTCQSYANEVWSGLSLCAWTKVVVVAVWGVWRLHSPWTKVELPLKYHQENTAIPNMTGNPVAWYTCRANDPFFVTYSDVSVLRGSDKKYQFYRIFVRVDGALLPKMKVPAPTRNACKRISVLFIMAITWMDIYTRHGNKSTHLRQEVVSFFSYL